MSSIIDNLLSIDMLTMTGADLGMSPTVVLREVRLSYELDSDGNKTDKVEACRYSVVDTRSYDTFTIKVKGDKPVITPQQFEDAKELIFLDIPVDEVLVRPYELAFGKAKVSITAPFVKLHKN